MRDGSGDIGSTSVFLWSGKGCHIHFHLGEKDACANNEKDSVPQREDSIHLAVCVGKGEEDRQNSKKADD